MLAAWFIAKYLLPRQSLNVPHNQLVHCHTYGVLYFNFLVPCPKCHMLILLPEFAIVVALHFLARDKAWHAILFLSVVTAKLGIYLPNMS